VRDDLHCNAVRLGGRDPGRLVRVAERALVLGLEVWLSPALLGSPADQTLRYYVSAAEQAERLHQRHPDRVVFVMGAELTLMMRGIVPGRDFADMRTYRGADSEGGALGFGIADLKRVFLHQLQLGAQAVILGRRRLLFPSPGPDRTNRQVITARGLKPPAQRDGAPPGAPRFTGQRSF
jgi:hypothetical protein